MIEYTIDTPTRTLTITLQDYEKSAIMEVYVEQDVICYTALADKEHLTDWIDLDAATE